MILMASYLHIPVREMVGGYVQFAVTQALRVGSMMSAAMSALVSAVMYDVTGVMPI